LRPPHPVRLNRRLSVPDLGAAESSRRETAVAEMVGSGINGAMVIAARAVDTRPEAKGGYLAERRERQREKCTATLFLRHDRLRFREPDPLVPERVLTPSMGCGESTFCLASERATQKRTHHRLPLNR
jgi:hypothetical protein